jgi:streptomycin 6-kinase
LKVFHNINQDPVHCRQSRFNDVLMELPPQFKQNVVGVFPKGEAWLQSLPELLRECENRWNIALGPPFELSFNYVAPAVDAAGNSVVLKAGVPSPELNSEIQALRLYDGDGAVRLLDFDTEKGVLLMERLIPGRSLESFSNATNDEEATRIAARVMRRLWRPLPADHSFATVDQWASGLKKLRQRFAGETGPFPKRLVEMAERLFDELLSSSSSRVLLHGDLHHLNVLKSRDGWKAIDPKGVAGEPSYEISAFMLNPISRHSNDSQIQRRRLEVLTEELGLDSQRMLGYAIAQSVLSAWWSFEDSATDWESALACTQTLEGL